MATGLTSNMALQPAPAPPSIQLLLRTSRPQHGHQSGTSGLSRRTWPSPPGTHGKTPAGGRGAAPGSSSLPTRQPEGAGRRRRAQAVLKLGELGCTVGRLRTEHLTTVRSRNHGCSSGPAGAGESHTHPRSLVQCCPECGPTPVWPPHSRTSCPAPALDGLWMGTPLPPELAPGPERGEPTISPTTRLCCPLPQLLHPPTDWSPSQGSVLRADGPSLECSRCPQGSSPAPQTPTVSSAPEPRGPSQLRPSAPEPALPVPRNLRQAP